ncbi:hypothetical protein N8J89_29110 [Crossiella sp. CA-258035]|uniref:hypothetical protein n=1 Tax=Crossiella sp. CA-258035 TaxID=2981138 RepID=UPI0024BC8619|nr:hypothetical protein [Crossiella sp. CA-258035]WHT17167.1 hypothetical protein N8J89_29110 [Crossiella sp. CA-258035]
MGAAEYAGETVRWRGRPGRIRARLLADLASVLSVAVLVAVTLTTKDAPAFAWVFGGAPVVAGFVLSAHRAYWLRRTEYVVTDSRVAELRHRESGPKAVRDSPLVPAAQPRLRRRHADGRGTIVFSTQFPGGCPEEPPELDVPLRPVTMLHAVEGPAEVLALLSRACDRR